MKKTKKTLLLLITIWLNYAATMACVDSLPPQISRVYFSVDTVVPNDSFTVYMVASDEISGLAELYYSLHSPTDAHDFSNFMTNDIDEWEQVNDSTYSQKIVIDNKWAEKGEWYVYYMNAEDSAGQDVYKFDFMVDEPLGGFYLDNSTIDVEDPRLVSVDLPDEIYVEDSFQITIEVTDNYSGLDNAFLYFENAFEQQEFSALFQKKDAIGGNLYRKKFLLKNKYAASGEWKLHKYTVTDSADNRVSSDYNYDPYVNIVNPNGDTSLPKIYGTSMTYDSVYLKDSFELSVHTYDSVGIYRIYCAFENEQGGTLYVDGRMDDWFKKDDTTYIQTISFDHPWQAGMFQLYYLSVEDSAENNQRLSKYNDDIIDSVYVFCDERPEISISVPEEDLLAKVHPNPNNGSFAVDIKEKAVLLIYDVRGQEVFHQNCMPGFSRVKTDLPAGMYLMQLHTKEQSATQRIVIH